MTPPPSQQQQSERQAKELADALKAVAQSVQDTELADMLIETIARVERHGDFHLRRQAQGVIGSTYVTLQERMDALLDIGRDTHTHMMDATTAISAIDERMAVFDRLLQEVSTRLGKSEQNQEHIILQVNAQSGRVDALRGDFQAWHDQVETTLADFRQSRERSIAERRELRTDMEASKHHRAGMQAELKAIVAQMEVHNAADAEVFERIFATLGEIQRTLEAQNEAREGNG